MFQYFQLKVIFCFLSAFLCAANADNSTVAVPEPKLPKCGPNEVATLCKYSCPPDTCDSLYVEFLCIADQECSPGCVCAKGYLRTNSTGVCIPQDRCLPPACANDPNAIRGCGDRCKKTCKDYNVNKPCLNNGCSLYGCDCKKGYVYDEVEDKCVRPKDCSPQCYGKNERYDKCINGNCSPKSCDDLGFPIACPRVSRCEGGCTCIEGYVRNKFGICIPSNECPKCGGDPNAVSGCGVNCGRRCQDRNNTGPVACPAICLFNGCDCKPNFFFDTEKQICVPPQSCPGSTAKQCDDPNAQWVTCAVRCPTDECPKNDGPTPVCDPPYPCPPGCRCKLGYKLLNGKCVLGENCPKVNCTRQNEVWAKCPECLAEDCSNKNDPPSVCNTLVKNCQPKCICKKDTFRDNNGICVPRSKCPK